MRLNEFATPDAQLELWKMVSDAVWSAINKQNSQQGHSAVSHQQDPGDILRALDAKVPIKRSSLAHQLSSLPKKNKSVKKLPSNRKPVPDTTKRLIPKPKNRNTKVNYAQIKQPLMHVSQRQQYSANERPLEPPVVAKSQTQPIKSSNFSAKTGK